MRHSGTRAPSAQGGCAQHKRGARWLRPEGRRLGQDRAGPQLRGHTRSGLPSRSLGPGPALLLVPGLRAPGSWRGRGCARSLDTPGPLSASQGHSCFSLMWEAPASLVVGAQTGGSCAHALLPCTLRVNPQAWTSRQPPLLPCPPPPRPCARPGQWGGAVGRGRVPTPGRSSPQQCCPHNALPGGPR